MIRLDAETVSVMLAGNFFATATALTIVGVFLRRLPEASRLGGALLWMAAAAFGYMFGQLLDGSLLLLPNLLLVLGALRLLDGLLRFRQSGGVPQAAAAAVLMGCLLANAYWVYVAPQPLLQIAALSLSLGPLFLASAITAQRPVPSIERVSQLAASLPLAAFGASMLLRGAAGLAALMWPQGLPWPVVDAMILGISTPALIACAFGLAAMAVGHRQRVAEQLAMQDSLTMLPNRRQFEARFAHALRVAKRRGRQIGVIFIDLDDFKAINDRFGHQAGDEVLKTVGNRLAAVVRDTDCLARLGGDEFAVLLEDLGSEIEVWSCIKRYKGAVEGPLQLRGESLSLRISCGMAVADAATASLQQMMQRADGAMYRDKQSHASAAQARAARSGDSADQEHRAQHSGGRPDRQQQ